MTFASPIGRNCSNWCIQNKIHNIFQEYDSLLVIEMIQRKFQTSIAVLGHYQAIQDITRQLNCVIRHCYRKADQVVDALAKQSIDNDEMLISTFHDLPHSAKEPYRFNWCHWGINTGIILLCEEERRHATFLHVASFSSIFVFSAITSCFFLRLNLISPPPS